jgi:hypothetical protein
VIREAKVPHLGWIGIFIRLNDKRFIYVEPILTPRGTPDGDLALGDLIEGVRFKYRKDLMMEAQKADLGTLGFGRQMDESGKYLDFKTACRSSFGWSAILQAAISIRA